MKYPIGTQYTDHYGRVCTVIDYHITRSHLTGDVVKERYVASHQLMGRAIMDYDVIETTIARRLAESA